MRSSAYGRNRVLLIRMGVAYHRTKETALCSTSHGGNGILFIGRGLAYRKTEETDLLWWKRGPVDREGCGVQQNGGNRLVLERYGRNGGPVHREGCGVLQNGTPRDTVHLHRRPPPASTGYCSSTIDLLHPPPMTVHPRAPVHPTSTAPPPATVQPALHGVVLFIQPSTGSCSSTPNRLDRSGFCSSSGNTTGSSSSNSPTGNCSSNPPTTLTVHQGKQGRKFDRLQLAAVANEGIARSGSVTHSLQCNCLGSVRRRLARVQLEPNTSHPRVYMYERNAQSLHASLGPDHPP